VSPLEENRTLGHYRIEAKVGSGGMGEVYRGLDLKLERPVAVKVLPEWAASEPVAVGRLLREAKAASSLNHPHIVTVYAVEEAEGRPFIVMEYVEGETLRDRLRRAPLELPELVSIGAKVADALHAAHQAAIIHRDVKSTNILLGKDGRVKVVDFGLAKQLGPKKGESDATGSMSLTATGAVVGTATYMSPEQTRAEPLDARTDVFSLGVSLYEAATGRLPFEGPSLLSVIHEIALVEPPAPSRVRPGLPRSLDGVLARALAKDRARRYQTAAEFAEALRSLEREDADGGVLAPAAEAAAGTRGPHNLPVALTSFVGRREEMAEVSRMLEAHRIVTLTGAGGCGKSRLALQIARNVLGAYADGAWLVELAPLADPALVPQRVAAAFGVREEGGRALQDTLAEALAPKSAILILDNCEHVAPACADLATKLIGTCAHLKILATSREPLGVGGEVLWRVPPLRVPDLTGSPPSRQTIAGFEAVRLFTERAAASQPSFALHEQNALPVAQICARLDGIPLAIELAAARIKVLPVAQILTRLEDRFRLLTGGTTTTLPHQQTLRAAVDWSYDLLDENERVLFDRLSVFAGGATLEAVEGVCTGGSIAELDVVDLLSHLVDKSLVLPEEGAEGSARYRLLETLREYGRQKLEAAGSRPPLLERHADCYLALAEQAEPELTGPRLSYWLDRLEEERDNMRQALQWAVDTGDIERGLRIAAALWRFWWVRGYFEEGRRRIAQLLERVGATSEPSSAGVRALRGAAVLARGQGDFDRARALLDQSLERGRAMGDRSAVAASLQELGTVADDEGRHEEAGRLYEESLAIRRQLGDKRGIAALLHNLGVVAQAKGEYARARELYEESLGFHRDLGNQAWEASSLNALGSVALDQGDHATARASHEKSLAIHRRLGDKWGVAYSLHELGRIAILAGDPATARALLCESIVLLRDLGDRVGVAESLEYFAGLATRQGERERALLLAGAAAAIRESVGSPLTPPDRASLETTLAPAREALGQASSAAALTRGRTLGLDEAIDLATSG
jgi:predicted ATPase/Tfp pilus assembly protein PilF